MSTHTANIPQKAAHTREAEAGLVRGEPHPPQPEVGAIFNTLTPSLLTAGETETLRQPLSL